MVEALARDPWRSRLRITSQLRPLQLEALAARNLRRNGVIVFATDASSHPGPSPEAIASRVNQQGGVVVTLLSGTCPTIDGGGAGASLAAGSEEPRRESYEPLDGGSQLATAGLTAPGQPPIDAHGDTPESATPIPADGSEVRGLLTGAIGTFDEDYFSFDVVAGSPYSIRAFTEVGFIEYRLFAPDGETSLFYWYGDNGAEDPDGDVRAVPFTPSESGTHYLLASGAAPTTPVARVSVAPGTAAQPYASYSTVALLTGGQVLLPSPFGSYDSSAIGLLVGNTVASLVSPTVVSVNPREVPREFSPNGSNMVLWLNLRGRRTHWSASSVVSFPDGDVTVLEQEFVGSTLLRVRVEVDKQAERSERSVQVTTPLPGGGEEVAFGANLITIDSGVYYKMLSFDPPTAAQGSHVTGVLEASGSNWSDEVMVDLGQGIAIEDVRSLAPNRLAVDFVVSGSATPGLRAVRVDDVDLTSFTLDPALLVFVPEPGAATIGIAALLTLVLCRRRQAGRSRVCVLSIRPR